MIATHTILQSRYRIDDLHRSRRHGRRLPGPRCAASSEMSRVKVLREVEHERASPPSGRLTARSNTRTSSASSTPEPTTATHSSFSSCWAGRRCVSCWTAGRSRLTRWPDRRRNHCRARLHPPTRHRASRREPSNLMLDDYGSVRLADFGIASPSRRHEDTGTHQAIGTMAYIAPEQLEGGEVGPPTDVYSLGLVLIECLTGRRAFDGPPRSGGSAAVARPGHPGRAPGGWPGMFGRDDCARPARRPSAAEVRDHLAGRAADPASGLATAPVAAAAVAATGGGGHRDDPGHAGAHRGAAGARGTGAPAALAAMGHGPARRRAGRRGDRCRSRRLTTPARRRFASRHHDPAPVTTLPPTTLPPAPPTTLPPSQPTTRARARARVAGRRSSSRSGSRSSESSSKRLRTAADALRQLDDEVRDQEGGGAVPRPDGGVAVVPVRVRVVEGVAGALVHVDLDVRLRARGGLQPLEGVGSDEDVVRAEVQQRRTRHLVDALGQELDTDAVVRDHARGSSSQAAP